VINTNNANLTTPPIFDTFSIKEQLANAKKKLASISDSPTLDAELLLANCIQKNQTYLHTWPEKILKKEQQECFQHFLEKRLDDFPVAYLLGKKEFWTLDILVTPDVLIPRPETELLVETALDKITSIQKPRILDLGTGSGAIALALASERNDASIIACDNSRAALEVAHKNAIRNHIENQVSFIQSNWFSNIEAQEFDLIVSNPPYIAPDDPHLLKTIRHEPITALIAENTGMSDIDIIIKSSYKFLKDKGWIIVEHGYDQSEKALDLYSSANYINAQSHKDLNDILRISIAQKP